MNEGGAGGVRTQRAAGDKRSAGVTSKGTGRDSKATTEHGRYEEGVGGSGNMTAAGDKGERRGAEGETKIIKSVEVR